MLQHLPFPNDTMFETIKAHLTFNYSKCCVYSQDLYEFPEEEILVMCPNSVQKVTKMRNSSNMVLLTFFGSTLPDRVNVRPINHRCFSCFGYGHDKSTCKEASRCGNYSALDSHTEEHCNAVCNCFHCRDADQLANTQFISLGSARHELLYRQKAGTGATSYALLAARTSVESAGPKTILSATSRSVRAGGPVNLANRFALLTDDSVQSPARSDENNTDLTKLTHVVDVHSPPASPKLFKNMAKRHRGSAESLDLAQPKQSKVSPGAHNRKSSRDRSTRVVPVVSVQPPVTPSVSDQASCDEDVR
ncbi:hypothetical protein E2C01_080919 [Portunus trituberculatus]|uniref:CCHC-type domain-containing protein n=1 Tax=Portunus trituberculatus TaxID=210409 RepID=A0A5B7IUV3_PORTR|nr:hypothetical protein [Portunus trituberculatus]